MEGEAGALDHRARRCRSRDEDRVSRALALAGERHERAEVPAALTGREEHAHDL
jgi:hypothetical protein